MTTAYPGRQGSRRPAGAAGGYRRDDGAASSWLLTFLAGVLVGALATWLWIGQGPGSARGSAGSPAPAGTVSAAQRAPAPDSARPALPPAVEVVVQRRDGGSRRVAGLIVALPDAGAPSAEAGDASPSGILLPLAALLDARHALVADGAGGAVTLDEVVAVAPRLALAVLGPAAVLGKAQALPFAATADLYLGRELTVLTGRGRRLAAYVDSPPRQSRRGTWWYALDRGLAGAATPAALLGEDGRLLGIAMPVPDDEADTDGVALAAYDVQALRPLWQERRPLTRRVDAFSETFFATDDWGRLLALREHARARAWQQVIDTGEDLTNAGWPFSETVPPLLEEAFQVRIAEALAGEGGHAQARRLLDRSVAALGWSAPRRLLAARIARSRDDVDGALGQLNAALSEAGTPAARDSLRRATRRFVADLLAAGRLGAAREIDVLRRQIDLDPDFADYHAALGRRLFDLARYREALTPLYRARGLDRARYGTELDPLIARAEERLYAPDLTVVPVRSQGATLSVGVRIPGVAGEYRFILDTGASITAISPRLLRELPAPRARGSVRLSTANGEVEAPLITLAALEVSGARVRDLDVVVLDSLDRYDGLLGLSFLDRFNMELDRNRNEMTLRLR